MRKLMLLLIWFVWVVGFGLGLPHKCIHDTIKFSHDSIEKVSSNVIDPNQRRSVEGINIKFVNVPTEVIGVMTEVNDFFVQHFDVLDKTSEYSVVKCNPADYDPEDLIYLNGDEDLVVFVEYAEMYCDDESSTIAYEITCHRTSNGRPFNIYVGICKNKFEVLEQSKQLTALIHEMYHGIGFDTESFALFPEENRHGGMWDAHNTIGSGCLSQYHRRGYGYTTFVGNEAIQERREFFGCKLMKHIELQGSHLSELLYHDQIMSPRLDLQSEVVKHHDSKLVFKILKDSGWYDIRQEGSDNVFGRDAGCLFLNKNCKGYYDITKNDTFYCFDTFPATKCLIFEYAFPIDPSVHRYFKDRPTLGGYDGMEYCPITRKYWELGNMQPSMLTQSNTSSRLLLTLVTVLIIALTLF